MRRISFAIMSSLSGLVMLFSYHTSTNSQAAVVATTTSGGSSSSGSSATSGTSSTPSASTSSSSSGGTYTGDAVSTQWGTVQVKITIVNGKITKSEAIQYPSENPKDQQINAYAVPQLNSEVVSKQSGSIDAVSGATVTSNGYIQSLQSAIAHANL
jgi:uncharacterized protein with FMN-binding domain